jgi:hypothetical protein
MSNPNIHEAVQQKYGEAAKRAVGGGSACCGSGAELSGCDPITKNLYDDAEKSALPEKAIAASLGCGNPTALAKLQPGEIVLDLGSGGGIDVILSAKRVGPTGKAYGLDMTDEMLALARETRKKRASKTLNSSKAPLRVSLYRITPSMSSSPTASSIFPVTRTASSAKRFACSSPADGLPSPILSFAAKFPPTSARAWNCGSAASPEHSKKPNTARSLHAPVLAPLTSSPHASTK